MSLSDLRKEIDGEVSIILGQRFTVDVVKTSSVPHSSDPAITFPNLDGQTQGAKLIDTCVLYIDIRRSTDLNLAHRQHTVAKLYSAFIRAMTRAARFYEGHVRGIIGDRLMVLFDAKDSFANAVNCAIAMNTVGRYIINKHFKANEVAFGIGIDAGNMLATKTGLRRHGAEQANYRNLVWLGRPANIASKLTDVAGKPAVSVTRDKVNVGYRSYPNYGASLLGLASSPRKGKFWHSSGGWDWYGQEPKEFLEDFSVDYSTHRLQHVSSDFLSFFLATEIAVIREATPPILMTSTVWSGFQKESPDSVSAKEQQFKEIKASIPGYSGKIFGGDIIFPALKE